MEIPFLTSTGALTLLVGWILGALTAVLTSVLKVWEQTRQLKLQNSLKIQEQETAARFQYVSPLRFVVSELLRQIQIVMQKSSDTGQKGEMIKWFDHIKRFSEQRAEHDSHTFIVWCNYEGIFAMKALHVTSHYLALAFLFLSKRPLNDINKVFSRELELQLTEVRATLAKDHCLWTESQDNIGQIVYKSEQMLSFDEFCKLFCDDSRLSYGPFLKLIDLYRDYLYRSPDTLPEIKASLEKLLGVLEGVERATEQNYSRTVKPSKGFFLRRSDKERFQSREK